MYNGSPPDERGGARTLGTAWARENGSGVGEAVGGGMIAILRFVWE